MLDQQPTHLGLKKIMPAEHHIHLFRHGRHQTLHIPRELELNANEAIIRRDGARLIIEPVQRGQDLATLLASWQPMDDLWPDIDADLQPLDDIQLTGAGTSRNAHWPE